VNRDAWLRDLFHCVDAKDSDGWLEFLTPDACFRFGNAEIIQGKSAIRPAIIAFFAGILQLRHHLTEMWDHPDTVICRGEVTYTRLDGSTLTIPFANILKMEGELIRDYLIYADASELYSPSSH
jgi:ketosteroid isomerase-like protein